METLNFDFQSVFALEFDTTITILFCNQMLMQMVFVAFMQHLLGFFKVINSAVDCVHFAARSRYYYSQKEVFEAKPLLIVE